jgi:glycosyltransferase involved in cell wall biosynthesis
MHIAIEASTWINPRGYGRFTRELTRALVAAGGERHRFTLVVDSGAARASDLPDIPIVTVPTRQAVVDAATVGGSRSPGDMIRMAARLSRGFDAVLFPTSYSFVPIAPGPFVVVVVHDALPEALPALVLQGRRARILWTLKSRLARARADLLATVSNASAAEMRRRLPIGRRDILVLTEGAASAFSPIRRPDDDELLGEVVPPGTRYVLYVGGLSAHKRVANLVEAFGEVITLPGNEDLRLVLAGPGERDRFAADEAGVAAAITALGGNASRVVRTGWLSDEALAALYRAAACAVLPSSMEGFGLPAIEAMASGTPLIVAKNAALEEVCGDAADYADPIESLPGVLAGLMANPARMTHLRTAGPPRARTFGWDQAARRLLAALDRGIMASAAPKAEMRRTVTEGRSTE